MAALSVSAPQRLCVDRYHADRHLPPGDIALIVVPSRRRAVVSSCLGEDRDAIPRGAAPALGLLRSGVSRTCGELDGPSPRFARGGLGVPCDRRGNPELSGSPPSEDRASVLISEPVIVVAAASRDRIATGFSGACVMTIGVKVPVRPRACFLEKTLLALLTSYPPVRFQRTLSANEQGSGGNGVAARTRTSRLYTG